MRILEPESLHQTAKPNFLKSLLEFSRETDTSATYLFAIVLDYVLGNAYTGREEELGFCLEKRKSRPVHGVIATDLDSADDLPLLTG